MKKETRETFREMGFGADTKQILMQLAFGAIMGIALLVFCAIGEWLNGLW